MNREYDYDYEWDSRYCYTNSNVLKNKLGITDGNLLHTAEREITALRIANAKLNRIDGSYDLDHLRRIHRYIFGDIYDWAGELRWVDISKGNVFCKYEYIEQNADKLFAQLKLECYLKKAPTSDVPQRLAYYLGEINILHPFRAGNGRTQRLFIEYLAEDAEYSVDFAEVTDREMIEASADAFACNYEKMNALFARITTPLY